MGRYSADVFRLPINIAADRVNEIEEGISGADFQRRIEDDVVLGHAQFHPGLEQWGRIRTSL